MTKQQIVHLKCLEGQRVSVALSDGSRLDDGRLVSAGCHGTRTLWIDSNGFDLFIPVADVIDVWESAPFRSAKAR